MSLLISIVGTPSPTLYATLNVVRALTQTAIGEHVVVVANSLEALRENLPDRSARKWAMLGEGMVSLGTAVVTAETQQLSAEESLLSTQGQLQADAVNLIVALGGGWSQSMLPDVTADSGAPFPAPPFQWEINRHHRSENVGMLRGEIEGCSDARALLAEIE